MRTVAVVTFALALALAPALPSAGALDPLGLQDDAGTGADAPDSHSAAVPLAPGDHAGTMDSVLDGADWFRVGPLVGQRLRVEVHATSGDLYVQVRDDAGSLLWQGYSNGNAVSYLSALGGSYRFGFLADEGGVDTAYAFRLDVVTPPVQNDGGLPGDAPGVAAQARETAAAPIEGLLHPHSTDTHDWYRAPAAAGKRVVATLSVAEGQRATVWLATAGGAGLAGATAEGGAASAVAGGNVGAVLVMTDGQSQVDYSLAIALVDPPAQNDAGLGIDAPAALAAAPTIPSGAYTGLAEVHAGDVDDAYRASAPAGHRFRASLTVATGTAYLRAFDLAGAQVAQEFVSPGFPRDIELASGAYTVVVGGTTAPAFTEYALQVAAVPVGDAEILGVSVDAAPADPDEPNVRMIRTVIENRGAGTFEGPFIVVLYDQPIGLTYAELLLDEEFTLAPYETREVAVPWDTTAFVGEFLLWVATRDAGDWEEIYTSVSAPVDPGLGVGFGAGVDLGEAAP